MFTIYLVEDKRILTLSVTVKLTVYSPLKRTLCTSMSETQTFSFVLYASPNKELFPPYTTLTPKNPELNPICCLLALLGAYHFLHVSRIRVKLLTLRLLMSYIYGAPILDVSR